MSDSLQSLFSRCDSVLVFDTETSGLSWQRDEIIEFSAIRLTASGTEESMSSSAARAACRRASWS